MCLFIPVPDNRGVCGAAAGASCVSEEHEEVRRKRQRKTKNEPHERISAAHRVYTKDRRRHVESEKSKICPKAR